MVVDPGAYRWGDGGWGGVRLEGQVLYELHIGTFTPEGTWAGALGQLGALADMGITLLEVMPVADFPGRFGWGYDGVDLYAPTRLYGTPDDFRHFVDAAHGLGLGVILDVVYNHLGPSGNYIEEYSPAYFTDRYTNEWGRALNFDGPDSGPVREFFIANAGYWIDEFHLDGLRLDATQTVCDCSSPHILREIGERVRQAARGRRTLVVVENERQDVGVALPVERGGYGLDCVWNDDFHHAAQVAATGRDEAYYVDFRGTPQELVSAVKHGYLFQGQRYDHQGHGRGTPALELEPARFVIYLQNHDQVANSAAGERLHQLTSPGRWRALTALLLLAPGTPLLFQGQEYAADSPFLFFADHEPELARAVAQGRRGFLSQFESIAQSVEEVPFADPADPDTFRRCCLDPADRTRGRHAQALALHRDLLALRREDATFAAQRPGGVDGAVLAPEAFLLRFFGDEPRSDRLLLVNLGRALRLASCSEPLIAPPAGCSWQLLWSSELPRYGGGGAAPPVQHGRWRLQAHAACVVAPVEAERA